jgi:hypothetical protein
VNEDEFAPYMDALELTQLMAEIDAMQVEIESLMAASTAAWEGAGSPGEGGGWDGPGEEPVSWEDRVDRGSSLLLASCDRDAALLMLSSMRRVPCWAKHVAAIGSGIAAMMAADAAWASAAGWFGKAVATGSSVGAGSAVVAAAGAGLIVAGAAVMVYDAIVTCGGAVTLGEPWYAPNDATANDFTLRGVRRTRAGLASTGEAQSNPLTLL